MLKKNLNLILLLVLLGAIVFKFQDILFPVAPCTKPIVYTLGTFDKKFNISQEYFLGALREAEAIWEKPTGKDLFAYQAIDSNPKDLKINLSYDYRQQTTSKLSVLGIEVANTRSSYNQLKAKFDSMKTEYEKQIKILNQELQDFEIKNKNYEADVKFWNTAGKVIDQNYDRLSATRDNLEQESIKIQKKQAELRLTANEINDLVVAINQIAKNLNLSVEKFNNINTSRGESFEEGVYSSDGSTSQIDIYEFSNHDKLVRVLAHELGHALGLEHVDDKEAIMYELNLGKKLVATSADLEALKNICKIK